MARSMTGYGRSSSRTHLGKLEVEVKSLNHRYLDVSARLPFHLQEFEEPLRKRVTGQVKRGKVALFIQHDNPPSSRDLDFNTDIARFYVRSLRRLKRQAGLAGEINLAELAALPHVISVRKGERGSKKSWYELKNLVDRALVKLNQSREREGRALVRDLKARLVLLRRLLRQVEHLAPRIVRSYRDRLRTRVRAISEGLSVDEGRISQEVAFFAEKCDITEEITRSLSHITSFEKVLRHKNAGIGRSLDFMTQELLREVNTIGSKSPDAPTTRRVIDMKGVLGKIREQVQNLE